MESGTTCPECALAGYICAHLVEAGQSRTVEDGLTVAIEKKREGQVDPVAVCHVPGTGLLSEERKTPEVNPGIIFRCVSLLTGTQVK